MMLHLGDDDDDVRGVCSDSTICSGVTESCTSEDNASETVALSCAHELFAEHVEVRDMINYLPYLCSPEANFELHDKEKAYERMKFILSQYKEQPHLLNPYLEEMLCDIMSLVRNEDLLAEAKHRAFKYLYLIINVRGYKVVVRHLPHEVKDLEPVLQLLEQQNPRDTETWETRYCLLIWLSIIVMLPFNMNLLDSGFQVNTVTIRVLEMGQVYLLGADSCRNAAALLLARLVIRDDVKNVHLMPFLNWLIKRVTNVGPDSRKWEKFGPLTCVAAILKHAKREDLLPLAPQLLKSMLDARCIDDKYPLSKKCIIKIISRIGLVFLKPRVANWRYNRGSRSLESNLATSCGILDPSENLAEAVDEVKLEDEVNVEDEEQNIPSEIEDVVEELIQGLKNENYITRWTAAKGVGRIVSRLNQSSGDDVVDCVMEVLNFRNSEGAWHGACMALAELAKRGLLLPDRLTDLIPLVTRALVYDEPRGFTSVGTIVRDAACYVCWAIARAYHPLIIEPYVLMMAKTLLAVTCFDREINCRRAAAAAFQESVGRLGNLPHGIAIVTAADYYTVGVRINSYLKISVFIAQFPEYTQAMIEYLLDHKVNHWDPVIRKLTAKALFNLTPLAPVYLATYCLGVLFSKTQTMDLHAQHGCILAIGEIIYALSLVDNFTIDATILNMTECLVCNLREASMLIGISAEPAMTACLSLIDNCSRAKLPFHGKTVIADWQHLIDTCLTYGKGQMTEAAAAALRQLCTEYYTEDSKEMTGLRKDIIQKYTTQLNTHSQTIRIGNSLALGSLPASMLRAHLEEVVHALLQCTKISKDTLLWAEARAAALKALSNICITIRLKRTESEVNCSGIVTLVLEALLRCMHDYTNDTRGDIGAWVREAAMLGIKDVLIMTVDEACELITPDMVVRAFVEVAQQAVEKIDRTRGIAGRVFTSLLHKEGKRIPYIPAEDKVRKIFTVDECENRNWTCSQDTFPLFIQLLTIPQFSYNILLGLVSSMGGLSESLASYASSTLFEELQSQPHEQLVQLSTMILNIFEKYHRDDRITIPLLSFTERLLASNCLAPVIFDPESTFTTDLLRYGKAEISRTANTKKLTTSVDFLCQLIQVPGEVSRSSLVQLGIMLCHRFLWLRRLTATKLIEALALYGEDIEIEPETMEKVQKLLQETSWDDPDIEAVRGKRNALCELLCIPTPRPGPGASQ